MNDESVIKDETGESPREQLMINTITTRATIITPIINNFMLSFYNRVFSHTNLFTGEPRVSRPSCLYVVFEGNSLKLITTATRVMPSSTEALLEMWNCEKVDNLSTRGRILWFKVPMIIF